MLCSRVSQLQGILQQIETTAYDTNDEAILRGVEQVGHDFMKCLETCKQIEKRRTLHQIWKDPSIKRALNELDRLLIHSLEVLSFLLEVSNYHSNAERRKDLKHIEAVVRNPRAGCYDLFSDDKLEKVEKLSVIERSPGVLRVGWERAHAEFLHYELEYDQQNGAYFQIDKSLNGCLLDSAKILFPSKFSYEIRMRAVNGTGPGEWSDWAVGKFTVLPSPPRKPLAIHVYSSTSVVLVVEKPPEEVRVKPVTHYVVNYHEVGENQYTTKIFDITELEALSLQVKDTFKLNLDWNIDATSMPIYNVKLSLRNADGDSLPFQDYTRTGTISPGKPVGLKVALKTTHEIVIEWEKPKTNLHLVNYYEVHWGRNGNTTKLTETKACGAIFKNLKSGKSYSFILRSVNKLGYRSEFIEINVKTKSMAKKVVKSVGEHAADVAGVTVKSIGPRLVPFAPSHSDVTNTRRTTDRERLEHYLKRYPETNRQNLMNRADSVEDRGKHTRAINAEGTGVEDNVEIKPLVTSQNIPRGSADSNEDVYSSSTGSDVH